MNLHRSLGRLRLDRAARAIGGIFRLPREVAESLGLSRPAAADALERLCTLGIARELTGRARDRVYGYAVSLAAAGTLLGD